MHTADRAIHAQRLHRLVEAVAVDDTATAEKLLSALLDGTQDDKDPAAAEYAVFGAALACRLSPAIADEANLYLTRFEVPQIHLFNLLAHEVPQVRLTTVIANRCLMQGLMQGLANQAHCTIIDIGIGTGRQMIELLEMMRAEPTTHSRRVTLIGIDPSASSLDLARENLRNVAERLGMVVDFHPICAVVESLTSDQWGDLAAMCTTRPVINGSFAFHHISDVDGRDVRNEVFTRLRKLQPLRLVLAEPDVDHFEPDFARRFANCWQHFGTTFQVIDQTSLAQRDKDALKVCFFGREISDILGNPEDIRSERHETAGSWLSRLKATGFEPCFDADLPASDSVIGVRRDQGYAALHYGDVDLVAVIASTGAGRFT